MPKVSVLMTVYNGGKYLPKSMEAVLSQTYKDFEFVIVDDCSTDSSVNYIQRVHDPRIVLVKNAVNIGQTKSLNVGLHQACGQYVARMDADDIAYPTWLEEQVRIMDQSPCAVLSPKAVVIDSHDQVVKVLNTPLDPQEIIFKSVFASPINHVGCLMHRETILGLGGYDERYRIVADYALWSKAIATGLRLKNHAKVLVAVRMHPQSVSIMEASKKVIPEMVDIMRRNAAALSKALLSEQETLLLWKTVYAGHTLSSSQFKEGLKLFGSIYRSFNLQDEKTRQFLESQERTLLLKRVWGLMETSGGFLGRWATRLVSQALSWKTSLLAKVS